jgi:pyruvate dehydrogenase E1 component beta subunit
VVVDQSTRHGSAAAVIAAEAASEGFSTLKAPVGIVTALDATIPYSQPMEEYLLPDEAKIVTAVQQAVGSAPVAA